MTGKRRCCIIYNESEENALMDELDVLDQVDSIEKHLDEIGISVYRKGISKRFMEEIESLAKDKPDFVFNLVESINSKGELNYFVPALLNMHSIPYSGNPLEALFITSNKVFASKMMRKGGINTPNTYLPSESNLLQKGRQYIVKPIWEDGSVGITSDSVFTCQPGFEDRIADLDDSHWFIEDYIDGREFNISIITGENGPEVLPLAEILFVGYDEKRPRIMDYKSKWEPDSFEYLNTVREFPAENLSEKLMLKLRQAALDCWNLFGLKGYARVDVRTDSEENVIIIEVNANPCISPDSGFVAAAQKAGYPFKSVVQKIINDLNI